ncbi:MAG: hypothetical protein ACI89L_001924 [Phycisphaerales bacterium]|jgi:hypothetical protein
MGEPHHSLARLVHPLAEVGDKVAQPLGTIITMLVAGLIVGALLGATHLAATGGLRSIGVYGRPWPWIGTFAALIALGSLIPLDLARFLLWDITDLDIQPQAIKELGRSWLWKCRFASCGGFATGLASTFIPFCLGSRRLGERPHDPGCCLKCSYIMDGLDRCPECGEQTAQTTDKA